ncbi:MAG: hypothetical protein EB003_09710 [Flavobacteriia bacterium]|nr:hypothetical protein [Flavobacteriia bacterium]
MIRQSGKFRSFQWEKLMTGSNKSTDSETLSNFGLDAAALEVKEKTIDYADIPELSEAWFQQARRASQLPKKLQVSLRIDEDILEFFKQQGSRYQTKMHAVLRAYVDGNKSLGNK